MPADAPTTQPADAAAHATIHATAPACCVVANPHALGFDPAAWRALQARLRRERGPCAFVCTPDVDAARAAIVAAHASGQTHLVLVGGDGTVQLALDALGDQNVTLELVAIGTANDLAHEVQALSFGTTGAAGRVGQRPWGVLPGSAQIDVLSANGHRFCTTAMLGIQAEVIAGVQDLRDRDLLRPALRVLGRWIYPVASLRGLIERQLRGQTRLGVDAKITLDDGEAETHHASCIFVSNKAGLGGTLRVSHGARCDDGILELTIVTAVTAASLARVLAAMVLCNAPPATLVRRLRGRSATVGLFEPQTLHADGEALTLAQTFALGVRPGALQVGR